MQQRLTVVRFFYDYLIEEGVRTNNPVGRGRYTPGTGFWRTRERGLLPRYQKLPWIPGDDEWTSILTVAGDEPLRNQLMLCLAYDGALRREEVCTLESGDLDPSHRQVRIRAEVTKAAGNAWSATRRQRANCFCSTSAADTPWAVPSA
jgi:integrase